MINVCTIWYNITRVQPEMGIYKRKQESKKTRKKELGQESVQEKKGKQGRKQELDQESDKEKIKFFFFLGRFLVFLIAFLVEFFFFLPCFLFFLIDFLVELFFLVFLLS